MATYSYTGVNDYRNAGAYRDSSAYTYDHLFISNEGEGLVSAESSYDSDAPYDSGLIIEAYSVLYGIVPQADVLSALDAADSLRTSLLDRDGATGDLYRSIDTYRSETPYRSQDISVEEESLAVALMVSTSAIGVDEHAPLTTAIPANEMVVADDSAMSLATDLTAAPDSAAGIDAEEIRLQYIDADSASGADEEQVRILVSDLASAVEAEQAPKVVHAHTDFAIGSSLFAFRTTNSDADTAAVIDAALPLGLRESDAGYAAVALTQTVALSSTELTIAADRLGSAVSDDEDTGGLHLHIIVADEASAAEAKLVIPSIADGDAGSGMGIAEPPAATVSSAETLAASDVGTYPLVYRSAAETPTGLDLGALHATYVRGDSGATGDVSALHVLLVGAGLGVGSDVGALHRFLRSGERPLGLEAASTVASVFSTDGGALIDGTSLLRSSISSADLAASVLSEARDAFLRSQEAVVGLQAEMAPLVALVATEAAAALALGALGVTLAHADIGVGLGAVGPVRISVWEQVLATDLYEYPTAEITTTDLAYVLDKRIRRSILVPGPGEGTFWDDRKPMVLTTPRASATGEPIPMGGASMVPSGEVMLEVVAEFDEFEPITNDPPLEVGTINTQEHG